MDDKPVLDSDPDKKVWYLTLSDLPIAKTVEVHPNLRLDLTADGRVVGIEGLGVVQFHEKLEAFWSVFYAGPLTPFPCPDLGGLAMTDDEADRLSIERCRAFLTDIVEKPFRLRIYDPDAEPEGMGEGLNNSPPTKSPSDITREDDEQCHSSDCRPSPSDVTPVTESTACVKPVT